MYAALDTKLRGMSATIGPEPPTATELLREMTKIGGFLPYYARTSYRVFCMRLDIGVMKEMTVCAATGCNPPYSAREMESLLSRVKRDVGALAEAASLGQLVSAVPELFRWKHGNKTAELCLALDISYHKALRRQARMDKRCGKLLLRLSGLEADLYNIDALYRLKNYFDADVKSVYARLLPFRGKLRSKELSAMAGLPADALNAAFRSGYYAKYFIKNGQDATSACRDAMRGELGDIAKAGGLAKAIEYIYSREHAWLRK